MWFRSCDYCQRLVSYGFECLFLILLHLIRFLSLFLVLILQLVRRLVCQIDIYQVSLFQGTVVVFFCREVIRTTFRYVG
jgi:hypothetical protein